MVVVVVTGWHLGTQEGSPCFVCFRVYLGLLWDGVDVKRSTALQEPISVFRSDLQ